MVEITYQMVLSTLQTLALIVGIAYYLFIMRNTQRNQQIQLETRQTQMFKEFNDEFKEIGPAWSEVMGSFGLTGSSSGWSWDDYEDFMRKYGPDQSPEEWQKFFSIAGLFERTGILAKEGTVNLQIIYDNMGGSPIRFWDKFEQIIDMQRIVAEKPPKGMWLEYFEDLVYMLRDIRADDIRDLDNRLRRRRIQREKLGRTMPDYL
jgi:hypothetical protein